VKVREQERSSGKTNSKAYPFHFFLKRFYLGASHKNTVEKSQTHT